LSGVAAFRQAHAGQRRRRPLHRQQINDHQQSLHQQPLGPAAAACTPVDLFDRPGGRVGNVPGMTPRASILRLQDCRQNPQATILHANAPLEPPPVCQDSRPKGSNRLVSHGAGTNAVSAPARLEIWRERARPHARCGDEERQQTPALFAKSHPWDRPVTIGAARAFTSGSRSATRILASRAIRGSRPARYRSPGARRVPKCCSSPIAGTSTRASRSVSC